MADYQPPLSDVQFLLKDVFHMDEFWSSLEGIGDVDFETAEAILEEAGKVCAGSFAPLNREADEDGCHWHDGKVTTPPGFIQAYQTFCEGGWGALGGNAEYDGMAMPKTLVSAVEEMVQGSCMSLGLAPMLTAGACLAIDAHASDALKQRYLSKMYSGEWSGAMDLTEPHAGTDLGIIRTKAVPQNNSTQNSDPQDSNPQDSDTYLISGTKIFITWGEHDMAENIVHLVLAKLPDAPEGSKGISLFLVPKFIPDAEGNLGERNAVHCGSIEKKMGIKASATCVMNFDGATGWLIGEPHKGLACMFTMMNYERLVVGIQAVGAAELSYQNALAYAQERLQSRSVLGPQCPEKPADPLLVHPDVRRMLMTMKSLNEGARAFYLYVAQWLDSAKYNKNTEDKKQAENMVALLTPIAKAFITDMSLDVAIHGQQIFGGHGFIREWGQEQLVRDIRITQIYEGTNGIQAMDLIGRKTIGVKGGLLTLFVDDVEQYLSGLDECQSKKEFTEPLRQAMQMLQDTTVDIISQSKENPHAGGAAAVEYLHMCGYVAYAYMWMRMAAAAERHSNVNATSKFATAQFYFSRILPRIHGLKVVIKAGASSVMGLEDDQW